MDTYYVKDDRVERAKRFSYIWCRSRAKAGKSQEYMALGLGVSKKTVQNWEKGTSSPTIFQGTEWFHLLGFNPLPYYYEFVIPDIIKQCSGTDEQKTDETLNLLVEHLPHNIKLQLIYLLSGKHGSSPYSIIQMLTAYLQTPLLVRVPSADLILQNYEMHYYMNRLNDPDFIKPDVDVLNKAILLAKKAAVHNTSGFSLAT